MSLVRARLVYKNDQYYALAWGRYLDDLKNAPYRSSRRIGAVVGVGTSPGEAMNDVSGLIQALEAARGRQRTGHTEGTS